MMPSTRQSNQESMQGETPSAFTSRRFLSYISQGVAAIAVPQIISARALAAPGRPGANDRIGMGFIGCGRQTIQKNIPLFMRTPGVQAVALYDVDSWRLEQAVKQAKSQFDRGKVKGSFSGIDTYLDYQDVLGRDDVDAVCIGTPDHWHLKMALDAKATGTDVALEKPIAHCIRDSQRYLEAAQKHNRIFRVDSEFRSSAASHRATWLVRNRYFGQVRRVEVTVPIMDRFCSPPKFDFRSF